MPAGRARGSHPIPSCEQKQRLICRMPPGEPTAPKWPPNVPDRCAPLVTVVFPVFPNCVQPEKLPATGYIPYRYVVLPYVFPHDTWVQGVQIMPSNPRVVAPDASRIS